MVVFERHNSLDFGRGADMGPRIFRTFDLIFVHRGEAVLELGRHRLRVDRGRAVLIYPQTLLHQRTLGRARLSGQHFSIEGEGRGLGAGLHRLVGRENGFEIAARRFSRRDEWDVLRALEMAAWEQTPETYERRIAQLVLLLSRWEPAPRPVDAGRRHSRELRRLVEWLEGNLDRPVTAEEMARQVGLSRNEFEQEFRHAIGATPAQFFLGMRMDACKRLLLESDAGIKSVARSVGFSDLPHFYRNFKKHTRKTPDQFRHALLS